MKQVNKKENLLSNYYSSGLGKGSQVPPDVKFGYNFGFWLFPFWCIAFGCYKPLWALLFLLIPVIGPVFLIIYIIIASFFANIWAWQYFNWNSIKEFKKSQNIWSVVSILIIVLTIGINIFYGDKIQFSINNINPKFDKNETSFQRIAKQACYNLNKALYLRAFVKSFDFYSSIDLPGESNDVLAGSLAKFMNVDENGIKGNTFSTKDGMTYAFRGNGKKECETNYSDINANCIITVDVNGGYARPNSFGNSYRDGDRYRFVVTKNKIMFLESFPEINIEGFREYRNKENK